MKKEKTTAVIQTIILVTALFNILTAALNLFTAAVKAAPATPASPPAISQQICPVPSSPAVIQYLNIAPPPQKGEEPSRPDGQ